METNKMNINDIRRLAGLKEATLKEQTEESELVETLLTTINEDEGLMSALRKIYRELENAANDPVDREDDLDRRVGAAAGEINGGMPIPSDEDLDRDYPHRAPDGRRLKYPHGDIRNLFHSSPDSREAGTDVVVPGGRVGKRLVDQPTPSRTNQDDRNK
jgi:hypothetical protein